MLAGTSHPGYVPDVVANIVGRFLAGRYRREVVRHSSAVETPVGPIPFGAECVNARSHGVSGRTSIRCRISRRGAGGARAEGRDQKDIARKDDFSSAG